MNLRGKVALITGGAGTIGFACARSLGRQGARIVIADRLHDLARDACIELHKEGIEAMPIWTNMMWDDSVIKTLGIVTGTYGRDVDIVVHCAAPAQPPCSVEELRIQSYWEQRETGLDMLVSLARNLAGHMRKQREGRIFAMGSGAARGTGMHASYAATKAAITAFIASLAQEWTYERSTSDPPPDLGAYCLWPAARSRLNLKAEHGPGAIADLLTYLCETPPPKTYGGLCLSIDGPHLALIVPPFKANCIEHPSGDWTLADLRQAQPLAKLCGESLAVLEDQA